MTGRVNKYTVLASALGLFLSIITINGHAQLNNQYNLANQLFQRGKYEEALPIFKKLHKDNPGTFLFFEKTAECLINLKRYNEAVTFTEKSMNQSIFSGRSAILLGRIYHVQGDTTKAFEIWNSTLENNKENLQIYLATARAMSERRAFDRSVQVYEEAKSFFPNSTLLSSELAGTYLQAGKYEQAINELLTLVREDPSRIDYVQHSLMRFQDDFLYDTAILEIDEFLDRLNPQHPSHYSLHQLEVWLLMERNLYERALATAKAYESRTSRPTFSLYGLGAKLLSERKFKLAEEAYKYYIENNFLSAKYQSMDELARVYTEWADYLADYNLANAARRDSLYQKAFDTLRQLSLEAPFYDRMGQVLIKQSELALDYLHDLDLAKNYLDALKSRGEEESNAQIQYVEGRILLYEGNYDRARIAFTRSKKTERIGELAEKNQYYLALTDFFSGDYEFAKIQLNALERQNTSYFANDAVQLRVWIQEGISADSTGSILEPFATAVEQFDRGDEMKAMQALTPLLSGQAYHPLTDEALLELSSQVNPELTVYIYSALTDYLNRWGQASPLRERLMWEKARIADQVVTNEISIPTDPDSGTESPLHSLAEQLPEFPVPLPSDKQELQQLYEEILLNFPDGFYASFARQRIQELQQKQT